MSLQLALSAALSGLRATQQQAALVSHNITNATTAGFVRKDLAVSTAISGGRGQGVRVDGVLRSVDEFLIRDARFEQSRYTAQETRASALADYATALGQPQDERSVSTALAKLQQSFSQLRNQADNEAARTAVVDSAESLVRRLHDTAAAAITVQTDAKARLQSSVDEVNRSLVRIGELNSAIATQKAKGAETGDLMDERDRLLDQVSSEIGIRTHTRESGEVVVMTRNGQTLLDRELPAGAQPLQLVGGDLVAGGKIISDNPDQDIQSGRIMGYVQTAHQDMPRALAQLDELAAGIVQQFQAAEADPTQPGLFTDAGAAYGTTEGLASRIAVNGSVRSNPWMVQSGVQAGAPLASGDTTQIDRFLNAFSATRSFAAADLPSSATLGDYATGMVSTQQGYRTTAESEMKTRKISADALQSARLNRDGVNVDDEMQKLLLIEQSYGASAQVLQAAGRMLDTLLQIRN
ncbi:flagellar hook-associated protein FlgK [Azospirillum brasilense]|uniref:flagellar hook-associated protein FlgK n=1 Tax=Azospirillum brasilense TaxID=192 RepID=UPI000E695C24|nr:flagellar hook-associated protein FlgK [Azospirillum brasilense]NUB25853.1 flagellar hook-associated protein FlgK [Azospirillum brasilense]NUB33951.1 flagellar hook-associated protein FlgK [Azospirillum brasilense]RIV99306.1 flagellar hook-associated protein FlgK [Azospirillum brasilense]